MLSHSLVGGITGYNPYWTIPVLNLLNRLIYFYLYLYYINTVHCTYTSLLLLHAIIIIIIVIIISSSSIILPIGWTNLPKNWLQSENSLRSSDPRPPHPSPTWRHSPPSRHVQSQFLRRHSSLSHHPGWAKRLCVKLCAYMLKRIVIYYIIQHSVAVSIKRFQDAKWSEINTQRNWICFSHLCGCRKE